MGPDLYQTNRVRTGCQPGQVGSSPLPRLAGLLLVAVWMACGAVALAGPSRQAEAPGPQSGPTGSTPAREKLELRLIKSIELERPADTAMISATGKTVWTLDGFGRLIRHSVDNEEKQHSAVIRPSVPSSSLLHVDDEGNTRIFTKMGDLVEGTFPISGKAEFRRTWDQPTGFGDRIRVSGDGRIVLALAAQHFSGYFGEPPYALVGDGAVVPDALSKLGPLPELVDFRLSQSGHQAILLNSQSVIVVDVTNGGEPVQFLRLPEEVVMQPRLSEKGRHVYGQVRLGASRGFEIMIHDLVSGDRRYVASHREGLKEYLLSADGNWLYFAGDESLIAASTEPDGPVIEARYPDFRGLRFFRLSCGRDSGRVLVWREHGDSAWVYEVKAAAPTGQ